MNRVLTFDPPFENAAQTSLDISEWNEEMLCLVLRDAWGRTGELRVFQQEWEQVKRAVDEEFAKLHSHK